MVSPGAFYGGFLHRHYYIHMIRAVLVNWMLNIAGAKKYSNTAK